MPIVHQQTTPRNSQFALWHITETFDELSDKVSAVERQLIISRVGASEKRVQKIAARACLRQMLEITPIFPSPFGAYGVLNEPCGKPILKHDGLTDFSISLSHGAKLCGALANIQFQVGLDVEYMNPNRSFETIKMFMNDTEQAFFQSTKRDYHYFYLVWCAKECLYKMLNGYKNEISFRHHLTTFAYDAFETSQQSGTFEAQMNREDIEAKITLHYFLWEDYMICYGEMNPQNILELYLPQITTKQKIMVAQVC